MNDADALELLAAAPLELLGRITTASNATLLCRLGTADDDPLAVYKPVRGEAPLWDFPSGTLHLREVAAYRLDRAIGLGMVPPTVVRDDAPYGPGSVQLFIEHDPGRHYFVLVEEPDPAIAQQLAAMVLFDLVANNADRKGSHVLVDADEHIWLCDHGLTFHVDDKHRTVAWDLAGEPVDPVVRDRWAGADERLTDALGDLLAPAEVEATRARARRAVALERFPLPSGPRPNPWPPL